MTFAAAAAVGQQLADEGGDLRALDRAQVVDDALGVALARRPVCAKSVGAQRASSSSAPSSWRSIARQRAGEQRAACDSGQPS